MKDKTLTKEDLAAVVMETVNNRFSLDDFEAYRRYLQEMVDLITHWFGGTPGTVAFGCSWQVTIKYDDTVLSDAYSQVNKDVNWSVFGDTTKAKVLSDADLAAIIKDAIISENLICDSGSYEKFLTDVALMVTMFFGGELRTIERSENVETPNKWSIIFGHNDCLPSDGGVFAPYDTASCWDEDLLPNAYVFSLAPKEFKAQRLLLLRLVAEAESTGRHDDVKHLDGLNNLLDNIADQAHDRHGLDVLLTEDDTEPVKVGNLVTALKKKFDVVPGDSGAWGECPFLPRTDWKDDVRDENTRLGYWEWVAHNFEQVKEEATEAGYTVCEDPDQEGMFYFKSPEGEGSDISYDTEEEAWYEAGLNL